MEGDEGDSEDDEAGRPGVSDRFRVRYVFLVAENEIKQLAEFMIENGFTYQVLGKQQKYNEHQLVMRLVSNLG